jgi:hypothetical protein
MYGRQTLLRAVEAVRRSVGSLAETTLQGTPTPAASSTRAGPYSRGGLHTYAGPCVLGQALQGQADHPCAATSPTGLRM